MSEISYDMAPYLHPDYWDGHSIGIGELSPWRGVVADSSTNLVAKRALAEYLQRSSSRFALETYSTGEVFDPAAYNPGTILCMKDEMLGSKHTGINFDTMPSDVAPAERDSRIQAGLPMSNFGPYDIILGGRDLGIVYQNTVSWGVVVRQKDDTAAVARILALSIKPKPNGRVTLAGQFAVKEGTLTVGVTEHSATSGGIEKLERVLRLEVCSYGKPQEKREPRFGLLGKLATGKA